MEIVIFRKQGFAFRFGPGLGWQYDRTTWSGHKGPPLGGEVGWGSPSAVPPFTGLVYIHIKHCDGGPLH
jgi:hypothetical protein